MKGLKDLCCASRVTLLIYHQPWALLLESEKAILSVSETFDECLVNPSSECAASDFSERIAHLDAHITSIIRQLDLLKKPKYNGGIESSAAQGMWRIATVLVHS